MASGMDVSHHAAATYSPPVSARRARVTGPTPEGPAKVREAARSSPLVAGRHRRGGRRCRFTSRETAGWATRDGETGRSNLRARARNRFSRSSNQTPRRRVHCGQRAPSNRLAGLLDGQVTARLCGGGDERSGCTWPHHRVRTPPVLCRPEVSGTQEQRHRPSAV